MTDINIHLSPFPVNNWIYHMDVCHNKILENKPVIKKHINSKVETISDLIYIAENNPFFSNYSRVEYNIDIRKLYSIKDALIEMNNFVGLDDIKKTITHQIMYYFQGLKEQEEYMHIILYGPPGSGKTEFAKCIGKLFSAMGVLNNTFVKATRNDLIGGYLGQTAIKTATKINEAMGGVLFIDEAYSLGHNTRDDIYSKECIDTLCEALSSKRNNLMVIIAGYKDEIDKCLFRLNSGLQSRFPWKYYLGDYKGHHLYKIFLSKFNNTTWNIDLLSYNDKWFENHLDDFEYLGRDIEQFVHYIRLSHSKRVFFMLDKKNITDDDFICGFELYASQREKKDDYINAFNMYT